MASLGQLTAARQRGAEAVLVRAAQEPVEVLAVDPALAAEALGVAVASAVGLEVAQVLELAEE